MNTLRRFGLVFALTLVWAGAALGNVIFVFNYMDLPGIGFNAPGALGQTRRDTLQLVADTIGNSISTPVPRIVNIDVSPSNMALGTPWLAGAGVAFPVPIANNTFNKNRIMQFIQTGIDPSPGPNMGTLQWNFAADVPWGYGTTVVCPAYDFRSTALHELTHHLGWATRITATGASQSGLNAYAWYDQFVQGWNGAAYAPFVNQSGGVPTGGTIPAAALTNTLNPLRFSNPTVNAAGGPFGLATLVPFAPGSSVAHFSNLSDPMGDSATCGQPTPQTYTAANIAVLTSMGYIFSSPSGGFLNGEGAFNFGSAPFGGEGSFGRAISSSSGNQVVSFMYYYRADGGKPATNMSTRNSLFLGPFLDGKARTFVQFRPGLENLPEPGVKMLVFNLADRGIQQTDDSSISLPLTAASILAIGVLAALMAIHAFRRFSN